VPKLGKEFLLEKLREQTYLLNKSVTAMTKGDLAEAVRVAASLRVLIHDWGRSKALLNQLNRNYLELEILDVAPPKRVPVPPGVSAVVVLQVPVGIRMTTGEGGGIFLNRASPPGARTPSILGRWWFEPSLIIPGAGGFSRREVVLGLADKEGGTHVDPNVNKKYQQLMDYKSLRVGVNQQIESLNVSRLMVGQTGVELLRFLDQRFPDSKRTRPERGSPADQDTSAQPH
jgi:hypothetical protein